MTSVSVPATHPRVTDYLSRLDAAVGSLPHAEACDIVREIQVHIADALAGDSSDAAVTRVLASLGTPEALAQSYRTELLFTRAAHSFSPWLLLRTAGRWARTGAKGFLVFLVGLAGYSAGLGLTLTVLLKPVLPGIGLWVGRGNFDFGMPGNTQGMHEVLGQSYVPVTSVLAFVIIVGTMQALRWMIRKRPARRLP